MKTIILAIVLMAPIAGAQDFGYEFAMLTDYRSLGASYNLQKFSTLSSNPLPDSFQTKFSTPLMMIEYRQNNGRFAIGFQSYKDMFGKERESFTFSGDSHNDFPVGAQKGSRAKWFIPVIVGANYLRAQSPSKTQGDFDIGSFGIGTGIKFKHFDRSFGIQAFAAGSLFYASEGFSTGYGSQTSICAEVQMIFPDILYEGMLAGYRYENQEWNMNNNTLDNQRQYHGAFVGILF